MHLGNLVIGWGIVTPLGSLFFLQKVRKKGKKKEIQILKPNLVVTSMIRRNSEIPYPMYTSFLTNKIRHNNTKI